MRGKCRGGIWVQLVRALLLCVSAAGFAIFFVPILGGILIMTTTP